MAQLYLEMRCNEGWSTRVPQDRLDWMLFERTALCRKILDLLGLLNRYLERDIEAAILRELEHFLLELGADFTFV